MYHLVKLLDRLATLIEQHRTVQRLYRGLMVIEEAEKLKVFDRNDRWNKYFNFSYICFGIDLDGIRNFLQIRDVEDENYEPVPHERKGS